MAKQFRLYGKYGTQKRFKAMDLKAGAQTGNLIFASILSEDEKNYFMEKEAPLNPEWSFEAREIPKGQQL